MPVWVHGMHRNGNRVELSNSAAPSCAATAEAGMPVRCTARAPSKK